LDYLFPLDTEPVGMEEHHLCAILPLETHLERLRAGASWGSKQALETVLICGKRDHGVRFGHLNHPAGEGYRPGYDLEPRERLRLDLPQRGDAHQWAYASHATDPEG